MHRARSSSWIFQIVWRTQAALQRQEPRWSPGQSSRQRRGIVLAIRRERREIWKELRLRLPLWPVNVDALQNIWQLDPHSKRRLLRTCHLRAFLLFAHRNAVYRLARALALIFTISCLPIFLSCNNTSGLAHTSCTLDTLGNHSQKLKPSLKLLLLRKTRCCLSGSFYTLDNPDMNTTLHYLHYLVQ